MDRNEIERRDFPAARRGYDAAAVQEHLRRVADELEARPQRASLAEGTSTQVRAILEAAESGAQQLREAAGREASDHVERVGNAARDLLARIERVRAELDGLLGGLKSTAESLAGELEELSREVGTLGVPGEAESAEPAPAPGEAESAEPAPTLGEAEAAAPAPPPAEANGARSDDEAGARLVALNMALEDTPRAETARYLGEHFELSDVEGLLDDVYASAGR